MTEPIHIDLAKQFSPTPLGRTIRQGKYSGEAFRELHLRKALDEGRGVIVDLDGASGLSTGFLDEAFAGLVRDGTLTANQFAEQVTIISDKDPLIIDEIQTFVKRAAQQLLAG